MSVPKGSDKPVLPGSDADDRQEFPGAARRGLQESGRMDGDNDARRPKVTGPIRDQDVRLDDRFRHNEDVRPGDAAHHDANAPGHGEHDELGIDADAAKERAATRGNTDGPKRSR